jgi:ribokinase
MTRVAVVGHMEWVEFLRVPVVPAPGEIVHASERWEEPGGGGAVAAVQLARLAGGAAFFTAFGEDELGRRAQAILSDYGVAVHAAARPAPSRRAITWVDAQGERTITVLGERMVARGGDPLPWQSLDGLDAVYFTGGDAAALTAARGARVLVATPRAADVLVEAGVELDVLVHSSSDAGEVPPASVRARIMVATEGAHGGSWRRADGSEGRFDAAPLPGPVGDAYGCGDSFAAGLTYGLGAGLELEGALALAARCGAAVLTGRGPYAAMLSAAPPAGTG